jgi:hypothetical protein
MGDYNDGLIPEPCLRLDFGFGQQYASVELGDGTGYVRVTDELRAALEENAKLRELVRIMHSEMVSSEDNGYVCGGHKFDERVSELGIEVDE